MNFSQENSRVLVIGDVEIVVEIADTLEKKREGLSGRESLPENQGMLFVYDVDGDYAFTMRGMNFPLDFIWIRDNKVVDIIEGVNVQSFQPPNNLKSKEKVDMILEINAGFTQKHSIKIGDIVSLK